jgi:hypothetical protein
LWCEVVSRGPRDHELHVVPQWNMSKAVVEPFSSITGAARRYAEFSWLLHQSGWETVLEDRLHGPRVNAA